jgi:hypothetical protein
MLPSKYESLPRREKAFIIASIQVKGEDEKKENDKISKEGKKNRRKRK